MLYRFDLKRNLNLVLFDNFLGEKRVARRNICLDTGCTLTTFYASWNYMKKLYPLMRRTRIQGSYISANGAKENEMICAIPDFKLTDAKGKELHILNFHFSLLNIDMHGLHVLLSGSIFYYMGLKLEPYTLGGVTMRRLLIDTYENNDIWTMKPNEFVKNGVSKATEYPVYPGKL